MNTDTVTEHYSTLPKFTKHYRTFNTEVAHAGDQKQLDKWTPPPPPTHPATDR